MEDVKDIEDELRDDKPAPEAAPNNGKTTVTILDDKDAIYHFHLALKSQGRYQRAGNDLDFSINI